MSETNRVQVGASVDDLRERVAQTIYGDGDELPWARCVQLADLVMWTLDLRRETTYAWNRGRTMPTGVRYVSKWQGVSSDLGDAG